MKQTGHLSYSQFPVFVQLAADYNEVAKMDLPSRHAVVLLAGDASDVPTDALSRVAEHLLARGLVYICTWGPDCERVHDIFDCAFVGDGTIEPTFCFMSTWHSSDTFDEAVEFFTRWASPADDACEDLSYLAILIGTLRSETQLSASLSIHLS